MGAVDLTFDSHPVAVVDRCPGMGIGSRSAKIGLTGYRCAVRAGAGVADGQAACGHRDDRTQRSLVLCGESVGGASLPDTAILLVLG